MNLYKAYELLKRDQKIEQTLKQSVRMKCPSCGKEIMCVENSIVGETKRTRYLIQEDENGLGLYPRLLEQAYTEIIFVKCKHCMQGLVVLSLDMIGTKKISFCKLYEVKMSETTIGYYIEKKSKVTITLLFQYQEQEISISRLMERYSVYSVASEIQEYIYQQIEERMDL